LLERFLLNSDPLSCRIHWTLHAHSSSRALSGKNDHRAPLLDANWLGTIYHGLPADSLRPSLSGGSYLAFLGRLTPDKGFETAIRLARAANMPLRIAAKLPRSERGYFKEQAVDQGQVNLGGW